MRSRSLLISRSLAMFSGVLIGGPGLVRVFALPVEKKTQAPRIAFGLLASRRDPARRILRRAGAPGCLVRCGLARDRFACPVLKLVEELLAPDRRKLRRRGLLALAQELVE